MDMHDAEKLDRLAREALEIGGFLEVMARKSPQSQRDIPAAAEAYTLLLHFLSELPLRDAKLCPQTPLSGVEPSVIFDATANRVALFIRVRAGDLRHVAHWLTDSLQSERVRNMPGLLGIPFSVEVHAGSEVLIPEWWTAFYVDGKAGHCVPVLSMQSVLSDARFSDWTEIVQHRLNEFGFPRPSS